MKNNINIRAKKAEDNKFEIIFEMDRETVKKRLELICEKIDGLEMSRKTVNEQLELLLQEKSQIELSLTQK